MGNLTLDDLKANLVVTFRQIAATSLAVGTKGRVLLLYKNADMSENYKISTFKSAVLNIEDETLEKQVKLLFRGKPKKVIVLEYKTDIASVTQQLEDLKNDFDWLTSADVDAQGDVKNWANENKRFAMVYNIQADSRYICSSCNKSAKMIDDNGNDVELNPYEVMLLLCGLCVGCPYDMSITYKVFTELTEVEQPDEYKKGQLVLYKEEEGMRLANGDTTLQTTNADNPEDAKSLTISECMYRVENDIIKGYRTGYKGKFKNSYDNQCLFYSAVKHGLFAEYEKMGILDPNYDNRVSTNIERQRQLWLAKGKTEAEDWTDEEVCNNTYKKGLYVKANVKFLDAMEDLEFDVEMF